MSLKNRMLQLYAKYDIDPTGLSRKLGYDEAEKIRRLTRKGQEKNMPSFQIIQDILNVFPEINARWLITGEEDMLVEEPRAQYGFCKECLKKEGEIRRLEKECAAKDKRIEELLLKQSDDPGGKPDQVKSEKKVS